MPIAREELRTVGLRGRKFASLISPSDMISYECLQTLSGQSNKSGAIPTDLLTVKDHPSV